MFGLFGRTSSDSLAEALRRPMPPLAAPARAPAPRVSDLPMASSGRSSSRHTFHDGEKFPGGYGITQLLTADYWTLRARSAELFETNIYGRGVIRRLVTNEINTGLHLESEPIEEILGVEEEALLDWSESVENRFLIWACNASLCDVNELRTFGALQQVARSEALVSGDVLVTIVQDRRTRLPRLKLINGAAVQTPLRDRTPTTNRIEHGVELDSSGRQIAYWVRKDDGTTQRLPAYGEKSGRRLAWLVYGTDNRLDDVRGKPLLSLILQSLKEVDRYRDSVQRKAVINAMLALFLKKTSDKAPSMGVGRTATMRGVDTAIGGDGKERRFNIAEMLPGAVIDELQQGEEPVGFQSNGTDEKFGDFESAIIHSVAWTLEIPPEILTLEFQSNYSASQAASSEFKMYLNKVRLWISDQFCQPVYEDWLISETLAGRITAKGLLESWRDFSQFDTYGAWVHADWSGQIKPAIDALKLVKAEAEKVKQGFTTRSRAAREIGGVKFSKVVRKLAREEKQLADARRPALELELAIKAAATPTPPPNPKKDNNNADVAD